MGDEAIGVITALHYSGALDTPANRKFAAAYRARYKKVPSYYSESMYTGGKWLLAAIEALSGRVEDREALAGRVANGADRPTCRAGPVELDEYGNPIENIYIRRVERVNGELQNTVIATLPRVSQFWKYNPAEYLKQPLYSAGSCRHLSGMSFLNHNRPLRCRGRTDRARRLVVTSNQSVRTVH